MPVDAPADTRQQMIHGSAVAFGDRGVLIIGASGRGKSALALDLIAVGAMLVADDQTILTQQGSRLTATCPAAIKGRIEARNVGILRSPARESADIGLVVDLDRVETERLPPPRRCRILGVDLPVVHDPGMRHFPAAIRCYVLGGGCGP